MKSEAEGASKGLDGLWRHVRCKCQASGVLIGWISFRRVVSTLLKLLLYLQ